MDEPRLIETADELDELMPAWEALAAPAGSPMQRHAWAKAFVQAYGTEYELKVVAIGSDGEVEAIAPLATPRTGINRLGLVAGEELSEPGDFVYRDRDALERLAAGVARLSMPVLLARVVADSPTVEALRGAFRRRTIFYGRDAAPYPWIALDEGWQDPEQKFKSDRRSDLRRARRRAEKDGEVVPEVLAPDRDSSSRCSRRCSGWRRRDGRAARGPRSPRTPAFATSSRRSRRAQRMPAFCAWRSYGSATGRRLYSSRPSVAIGSGS